MTASLDIAPALGAALSARGYDTLTPVQAAMLEPRAKGRDLLVSAQTGSGKTVAFGIAMASELLGGTERFGEAAAPLGLVIAPTRELAMQVRRELEWLYAEAGARIASCVGGMDMRTERRALEQGAHIVVGTPGRLRDHITRGALDLSSLRAVVLDEADEMLDLGFKEDLEFILSESPDDRRTLLFSATVPAPIEALARKFQKKAERLEIASEGDQHEDIEYRTILVSPSERDAAVVNTLLHFDATNALVFCSTREAVKRLAARLGNRGFRVVSLSGELSQAERSNALQWMRDGRARVCVATDVAARGIDLPNLDLVIHADLPSNPETLLHRSGRTGRAGRKGVCALIVPHHRRGSANRLLKMAGLKAEPMQAPGAADIDVLIRARVLDNPALGDEATPEELSLGADLVARYGAERIAAALVKQLLAQYPSPEELSDGAPAPYDPKTGERPQTRFESGTWFVVSIGRRKRAEPRWLLPLICKAGNVTKAAIGSIRILEDETRFEVAPDKADAYAQAIARPGAVEKGVTIAPLSDDAPPAPPREKRTSFSDKPRPKKHFDKKPPASAPGAARAEKRKLKKARKKLKAE
ncbi:DEAD/DEAH box helicase [Mesorhizobium sp. J428]|uniref:DEAD/DEAH box helicase n=1 Tax=Mesorhizobium sp. J428 TaxID=2898440 RepID=UPI0021518159|nr:DEAD/DEAH box helicase [Mesorhizobium sp. J428]MCR5855681.1 DEAD/DEAH box helicase [Mesorhizobium sp. J428]